MSCKAGSSLGDPSDTQFYCPEKSKYYKTLSDYKIAGNLEDSLVHQDTNVGQLKTAISQFDTSSNILLGKKGNNPSSSLDFTMDKEMADARKYANLAQENLKYNQIRRQEINALKEANSNTRDIANSVYHQNNSKSKKELDNKSRIIQINNNSFFEKKTLVSRLVYIVYFLVYAITLGVAFSLGVITMRNFGIALLIGLVLLATFTLGSSSSDGFLKTYGEESNKIVKDITREFVSTVAPIKKCPKRCQLKKDN